MRKWSTFLPCNRGASVCLVGLAVAVALAACGSGGDSVTSVIKHRKPVHAAAPPARPGEDNLADMVAAASPTPGGAPVDLKFLLAQRPEVGRPLEVRFALIPGAPAPDHVYMIFMASEGMEVVGNSRTPEFEKPAVGTPIRYTVKVTPKRDGIFTLSAIVSVEESNQITTRTFSIPVIAGEGMAELTQKSQTSGAP